MIADCAFLQHRKTRWFKNVIKRQGFGVEWKTLAIKNVRVQTFTPDTIFLVA